MRRSIARLACFQPCTDRTFPVVAQSDEQVTKNPHNEKGHQVSRSVISETIGRIYGEKEFVETSHA